MSKKQQSDRTSDSSDSGGKSSAAGKKNAADPRKDGMRETVESVVIAFILAFLFRTFEAEAFVIPTGSMAPTLMGRNKDLACANCGFTYQVNASEEVDANTNQARPDRNNPKQDFTLTKCTCPVCRYTMDIAPGNPNGEEYASYKGDRILVTKFAYQFADPERYDVIVFKYPGEATTNFIKRLVGLPNETTQIYHGNIWSRKGDQTEFQIERKPARKIPATLQMVHDNSVADDEGLVHDGWPQRWQADAGAAWQPGENGDFSIEAKSSDREDWLHYRHIVPILVDWDRFLAKQATPASMAPPPQLITDFTSYNTNYPPNAYHPRYLDETPEPEIEVLGQHWVGDLAVECDLTADSATGEAVLELVEGGVRFQCRFDLATGQATLTIDGQPLAKGPSDMVRGEEHRVRFANIDDQLLVWVDDDLVEFDKPTTYNGPEADSPHVDDDLPQRADLTPVGIAAKGTGLKVGNLRVLRDVYYIASKNGSELNDYREHDLLRLPRQHAPRALQSNKAALLRYLMSTPELWPALFPKRQALQFKLGPDQFVVLGDNSARSKDSRLWGEEGSDPDYPAPAYCVTRDLLIGKALFIYWPHSWDRTSRDGVWFPFFPNFARMGFVR